MMREVENDPEPDCFSWIESPPEVNQFIRLIGPTNNIKFQWNRLITSEVVLHTDKPHWCIADEVFYRPLTEDFSRWWKRQGHHFLFQHISALLFRLSSVYYRTALSWTTSLSILSYFVNLFLPSFSRGLKSLVSSTVQRKDIFLQLREIPLSAEPTYEHYSAENICFIYAGVIRPLDIFVTINN